MWRVLLVLGVFGTCRIAAGPVSKDDGIKVDGPLEESKYPYYATLDVEKNYGLQWNFNSTHIIFQIRVKTTGYIGFGISDHGKMFPSDVIIAWVKDGEVHLKDRHASGYFMPAVDKQQNWDLVSGSEDGQYTTITVIRKLDTCDDQDMPITAGTTRLIYSYSQADPESEDSIPYHVTTRGTKSVLLLDPPAGEDKIDQLPDDVITMNFQHQNYSVPSSDTTYACRTFKMPPLNGKHHMIRYEPIIQEGHEKLVHHMLLYYCTDSLPKDSVDLEYECYEEYVSGVGQCVGVLVAWAIGATAFDYPAHVGYSLGDTDDPKYFRLEVHYDNPQMRDDFVDSSGVRLFLTKQLRQYDAGVLETGVDVNKYHIIPPHFNSFLSTGQCPEKCIDQKLGDKEIKVFANFLHSHLLGRKLSSRHFRNGVELEPIMEDNNYDFDYQESRKLTEERIIKKGDSLMVDCYYDSSKRNDITYGGLSTREEMCLSYLLYYPKIDMLRCESRPIYKDLIDQRDIFNKVRSMDFTQKPTRDEFQSSIQSSAAYFCQYHSDYDYGTAEPNITQSFIREDQCKKN